jgi:ribonuclease H2 subunit A
LNSISHDTAINLINRAIGYGINVKQVFVDTVGPADKYEAKLKRIFPSLKIKVANKADSIYPIVSAASICAKVIRDRTLKDWKFIEKDCDFSNKDYGSGYPSGRVFIQSILLLMSFSSIPFIISDPTTKKFLSKNIDPIFGFPTLVRFSWSTVKNLLDEKAIECEWFVTLLSLL